MFTGVFTDNLNANYKTQKKTYTDISELLCITLGGLNFTFSKTLLLHIFLRNFSKYNIMVPTVLSFGSAVGSLAFFLLANCPLRFGFVYPPFWYSTIIILLVKHSKNSSRIVNMGKINLNDLEDYEEDYVPYEPIKKKKKKVTPIYNKEVPDKLDD